MAKTKSQKLWELAHPKKQKQYLQSYLADKTRIIIPIHQEDGQKIDKLKNPSESRSQWVKELVLAKLLEAEIPTSTQA